MADKEWSTKQYALPRAFGIFTTLPANYSRRRSTLCVKLHEKALSFSFYMSTYCNLIRWGRSARAWQPRKGPVGCVTGRLSIHYPFCRVATANKKLASRLMVDLAHVVPRSNKCDYLVYMNGQTSQTPCLPRHVNKIFLRVVHICQYYPEEVVGRLMLGKFAAGLQ